jgi:putative transposase
MKKKRFTEEQIIGILREQEAGAKVADLARKYAVSEATLYNWKAKFGGMDASEAKRLKALGGRERKAEEASGGPDARGSSVARASGKKCMVRPVRARVAFVLTFQSA